MVLICARPNNNCCRCKLRFVGSCTNNSEILAAIRSFISAAAAFGKRYYKQPVCITGMNRVSQPFYYTLNQNRRFARPRRRRYQQSTVAGINCIFVPVSMLCSPVFSSFLFQLFQYFFFFMAKLRIPAIPFSCWQTAK